MVPEKQMYNLREKKALRSERRKRIVWWGFVVFILVIEILLMLFLSEESDTAFYLDLLSIVLLIIAVMLGYRDLFPGGENKGKHYLEIDGDVITYHRKGLHWTLSFSQLSSYREKETRMDLIDRKGEAHSMDLSEIALEDLIMLKRTLEDQIDQTSEEE